jgi:hypothetical protein
MYFASISTFTEENYFVILLYFRMKLTINYTASDWAKVLFHNTIFLRVPSLVSPITRGLLVCMYM